MRSKKLLALGMASLMMLSTVTVAFGADETVAPATGSVSGSGDIVGYVDKDVFTVTLPTSMNVNFALDPQELKLAVDPAFKVDAATASAGYGADVLFTAAATDGGYAKKSKSITVVNKSTFDVDVSVNAKVTGLADETAGYDIKLVDPTAEGFDWGTDTSIALLLTPSTNTLTGTSEGTATPVSADAKYLTNADAGVTIKQKVAKSANVASAYEVKEVTTGKYAYQLKTDVSAVPFNQIEFNLSGKVNTDAKADWSKFNADDTAALNVDITYTVDKHVDGPALSVNTSTGVVTISNLPSTESVNTMTIKFSTPTKAEDLLNRASVTFDTTGWSSTDGGTVKYTYAQAYLDYFGTEAVTLKITLSDGTTLTSTDTFNN